MGFDGTVRASQGTDGTMVVCTVTNSTEDVNADCAGAVGLTVHTYGMSQGRIHICVEEGALVPRSFFMGSCACK